MPTPPPESSPHLPATAAQDLQRLHDRYCADVTGKVADYIPELAKADTGLFALAVCTVDGQVLAAGDADAKFTLQSMSKPFAYAHALDLLGREHVHASVGVEPTGEAFNSIVELEEEVHHKPYNPMINSGAITIAGLLLQAGGAQAWDRLDAALDAFLGRTHGADEATARSELETADRNRAIAWLLRHFQVLDVDVEEVLRLYGAQCATLVDARDLAVMAATLANGGVNPRTGVRAVQHHHVRDVLTLMFTCGMYDTSGEWAWSVGLPAKSGVSGGILAVVPGVMGLAAYSPALDKHGHSVRAMAAFKDWAREWGLGVFGPASGGAERRVTATTVA